MHSYWESDLTGVGVRSGLRGGVERQESWSEQVRNAEETTLSSLCVETKHQQATKTRMGAFLE
jgi:hypothetical protein